MSVPIVGKVVRLHLFGQFCRTLATLLQNGVPVLKALEIAEQIVPNRIIKQAIAKTRQEVTDGKTIAQPMARSKVFPQLMVDLIKIGEDTGDVPGSLANLAETYESELNIGLRVMTNMIEPIIICVMAMGVGFLLIAILTALFSITTASTCTDERPTANLHTSWFLGGTGDSPVPPGHPPGGKSKATFVRNVASRLQSATLGSGRRVADRHRRVACATRPKRRWIWNIRAKASVLGARAPPPRLHLD